MCLAIPMKIISRNGHLACCEAKGVRRDVSLALLEEWEVVIGGFVLVHVGYAIQTISVGEAKATWDLLDEMASHLDPVDA
jgi:hydrogenase expression/formation protein HypC